MTRPGPRTYTYFIDGDGDWWCDGWLVEDPELRAYLSAGLFRDRGRTWVRCENEVHPVTFEITPLFVRDVDIDLDTDGHPTAVRVRLHDERIEPLRLETLRVDDRDRLFCDAGDTRLPALFFRPAYYQLMQHLGHDDSGFYLPVGGRRWAIREGRPDPTSVLS